MAKRDEKQCYSPGKKTNVIETVQRLKLKVLIAKSQVFFPRISLSHLEESLAWGKSPEKVFLGDRAEAAERMVHSSIPMYPSHPHISPGNNSLRAFRERQHTA